MYELINAMGNWILKHPYLFEDSYSENNYRLLPKEVNHDELKLYFKVYNSSLVLFMTGLGSFKLLSVDTQFEYGSEAKLNDKMDCLYSYVNPNSLYSTKHDISININSTDEELFQLSTLYNCQDEIEIVKNQRNIEKNFGYIIHRYKLLKELCDYSLYNDLLESLRV